MRTRRDILRAATALPLLTLLGGAPVPAPAPPSPQRRRPHVLMIGVDDLRTTLGCYGDRAAVTPNIDALAARGTLFGRAYVQQAVCAASRASLLTGCRPDTTGVDYPYNPQFIDEFVDAHPTIPTWFDGHGYFARIGGKIHHQAQAKIEQLDAPPLEDRPGHWMDYALPDNAERAARKEPADPYEAADVEDAGYRDGFLADRAVEAIRRYAAGDDGAEPMFLGVGFRKPHLPFNAPERYWDLYDADAIPDTASAAPAGAPGYERVTHELPTYRGGFGTAENPVPPEVARTLRHGYYACVSYVDAQVGKLMAALAEAGLAGDTLVCLWSDHGFHLGDNGMWGKHVNYEVATHAPLIFAGPGVPAGQRTDALVEYVDIYPTLCDLAGVEKPGFLEGDSLRPLIDDPDAPGDEAAFSQYPRGNVEGYSARTDRWRYVEWHRKVESPSRVIGRELYDHAADPREAANVAADNPQVVAELSALLAAQFGLPKRR